MKFILEIDCDNDAFADDLEASIAKVLRHCANRAEEHSTLCQAVYDRNGNRIGSMRLIETN